MESHSGFSIMGRESRPSMVSTPITSHGSGAIFWKARAMEVLPDEPHPFRKRTAMPVASGFFPQSGRIPGTRG